MQRFYAEHGGPREPLIPSSTPDGEVFRLARARAGSPLQVRAFFSATIVGMFASRVWPGDPPEPVFWALTATALLCIGSYYLYWGRSGAPLNVIHAWMLALPSQEDPGVTRVEWVFFGVTGALFATLFLSVLFG
jgi:hypothetical protein